MSAIYDSHIFGSIFGNRSLTKVWSDENRTAKYLEIEAALARAQAGLGIIPEEAKDEIVKHCHVDVIDFDKLREKTEVIGYPVLGVVQQIVANCDRNLGEWCHWGATTQDITDTATVLQIRESLQTLEGDLDSIISDLTDLSRKYRDVPMAGRSNLQQAVPITFGFKCARFLATFRRHRQRLNELKKRVYTLEFGGAAGNLVSLGSGGLATQEALAKELDLNVPEIAWHTEHDRFAEVGSFLALLTGTCAKLSMDVKLMMQTEVGEVSERYEKDRGSSSTMPQKRNPISCCYIHAMASSVRHSSAALMDSLLSDHERGTGPWEIIWIELPHIMCCAGGCLAQTRSLVSGLEVHPEKMATNLALTNGLIVSEAVMMGLAPKMGRQRAHDVVYALCRKALSDDRPLLDLLIEDNEVDGLLSREELQKLCDPATYLGQTGEMIDKVLAAKD